ncbi:MAG: hypothetical protein JW984_09295 [Deltaproteobacteria bacterium]|uniref:RsbT co-antagonist protein RsbRD N-terminal domain-containing protein n=1 Tax=Candidatus Zymogenus saltonus TaxID=2844893 RepID=A0A9D8KFT5_9DELT|nr:hypothetical protein [Candidatus Zymogenus saltonus]
MINERLVRIVRGKKDNILGLWLKDFKEARTLRTEEGVDETKFKLMMADVLEGFDNVMEKDVSKYRLCLDFTRIGDEFFKDNYAIHDIVNALTILKKVIMEVVTTEGFFSTAFELYQLQELNNKAVLYFDRAIYYAALGYEDSMKQLMEDKGDIGKLKKFFGATEGRMKYIHSCALEAEK